MFANHVEILRQARSISSSVPESGDIEALGRLKYGAAHNPIGVLLHSRTLHNVHAATKNRPEVGADFRHLKHLEANGGIESHQQVDVAILVEVVPGRRAKESELAHVPFGADARQLTAVNFNRTDFHGVRIPHWNPARWAVLLPAPSAGRRGGWRLTGEQVIEALHVVVEKVEAFLERLREERLDRRGGRDEFACHG